MKKQRLITLASTLIILVLACACPGTIIPSPTSAPPIIPPTSAPPIIPPPTTTLPSDILFSDDFSNPGSGWEVGEYEAGSVGYRDGYYFVTSSVKERTMWGVANRTFQDTIIEVDVTQAAGSANNNDYGVICRLQPDRTDGYFLLISGDGFYSIQIARGEDFQRLVEWTASSAIKQGNTTNHIRATCNGSHLALEVNGEILAETNDSTFASGDIALQATTYEVKPTEIHFDNLVVRRP